MRLAVLIPSTALTIALGFSTACGDATVRTAAKFCGELKAHANEIQTPPKTADEIPALITLYSKMAEVAPLNIEGDWETVYGALKTANTVNAADPASVQKVADSAYAAQQSAQNVVTWAKDNCGIDLVPVGIVPGGATIDTSVTTTTAPG